MVMECEKKLFLSTPSVYIIGRRRDRNNYNTILLMYALDKKGKQTIRSWYQNIFCPKEYK